MGIQKQAHPKPHTLKLHGPSTSQYTAYAEVGDGDRVKVKVELLGIDEAVNGDDV